MSKIEKKIKIGWLSTGNGIGSLGLLKKGIELFKENHIEIKYVFTNRELGEKKGSDRFINFILQNNIKNISFSSEKFKKNNKLNWKDLRVKFDQEVLKRISNNNVDFIVSAGYMLISPVICNHFKIINLHPALPDGPNGTWKNVIEELIISKKHVSGVSAHLMTEDLDEGPNISYCKFNIFEKEFKKYWEKLDRSNELIKDSDLFNAIRQKMLKYERELLKVTLLKISQGKIDINNDKFIDLSKEVNKNLSNLF
jgi:folate-dependent phosphoribosylglycinamide formyltransferase PurN